jgi:hypothetical protein
MQHNDECHTAVRRHLLEEPKKRLNAARRRADAYDGKRR